MKPSVTFALRLGLVLLTLTGGPLHGQNAIQKWVQSYNGPGESNICYDFAYGVAVDGAGNVAVTGASQGYANRVNYFTLKYAFADGALLWAKGYNRTAAPSYDSAYCVAVDGAGNVVVTGQSLAPTGYDFYTEKYAAANGAVLWGTRQTGSPNGIPVSIAIDSAGNVAVTGSTRVNPDRDWDFLTVKYAAADGALLWGKSYNGPGKNDEAHYVAVDNAHHVAVDNAGNVAVTGESANANGNKDYYTVKYAAADGALLWEKRYNGPGNGEDIGWAVATDNAGNVAVTGFSTNLDGNTDYYTAKYAAADGALIWEKRYNGAANNQDEGHGIAMDSSGNVVVTGQSWAEGIWDYYTAKYAAADGALLWEKRYRDGQGYSVAVDSSGNVAVTGQSHPPGGGSYDYYTAKYAAADGALLWEGRYNGLTNSGASMTFNQSYAGKLALTPDGGAVVTGASLNGTDWDYATVRYAPPPSPVVTTSAVSGITGNGATLNGTVNPNGGATTARFEYGLTDSYGATATVALSPNDGSVAQPVTAALSGLTEGTTYYYRLTATNPAGTSSTAGSVFTTHAAEIVVEQPEGVDLIDGGTASFGAVVVGKMTLLTFTIRNTGAVQLTGLALSGTGVDAVDFGANPNPIPPVSPNGSTTFTVTFAPTTGGPKTAALHIASNDTDENPFDITLVGMALSYTTDTDGDGLNDASESQMASLGFDWQSPQSALVNTLYENANGAGLYTTSQTHTLNVGVPLLTRDAVTGTFKLILGLQKSTTLGNFEALPFTVSQTAINADGKIEFEFTVPDNAAFFRVHAQ